MSSVSRSSRISAKSMVIIEAQDKLLAEQGGQITDMAKEMAMMKRLLEEAGIKPTLVPEVEVEKSKGSKKRLPSGSPDGKIEDPTDTMTGSSSGSDSENVPMDEEVRMLNRSDFLKKGREEVSKPPKNANKKARRLARAKENCENLKAAKATKNIEAFAPASKAIAQPDIQVHVHDQVHDQVCTEKNAQKPAETVETAKSSDMQVRLFSEIVVSGSRSGSGTVTGRGNGIEGQIGLAEGEIPVITPVFKTPQPDGPFKDEIVIEVQQMNGQDFYGTITPTEARITIFEGVLGLAQDDLAGVTVGFNRGRTITYKLKQQRDIDQLYRFEFFEFKRSKGQEVSTISCKIRGLRDPETRTEQALRPLRQPQEQHFDDGTRLVRIIGCEYRLLESEILDWLSLYGDVISEITEEPYLDADEPEDGLPPIGNGTYLVKMKMRRDMPNWVPMYGRKVCFSYRGIKKQCNSCFGPHLRKYCKNEKMTLEEYTDKFRPRNKYVPEQLYGRLAKLENIAEQQRKLIESETIPPLQSSGSVSGSNHGPTRPLAARNMTTEAPQVKQTKAAQGRVVINLRKKKEMYGQLSSQSCQDQNLLPTLP